MRSTTGGHAVVIWLYQASQAAVAKGVPGMGYDTPSSCNVLNTKRLGCIRVAFQSLVAD
jgi:hypothetical protein